MEHLVACVAHRTTSVRGTTASARARAAAALVLVVALGLVPGRPAAADPSDPAAVVVAVGGRDDGAPACDPGASVSSSDAGITWPTSAAPLTPSGFPCVGGGQLFDVASRGSVLVAVGTRQTATGTQGVSFRSVDGGATWVAAGTVPPTPPGTVALESVANDDAGRWVAGGATNGTVSPWGLYYSDDDGSTWTPAAGQGLPMTVQIHDVAERPGTTTGWVAVGSARRIGPPVALTLSSGTGASWGPPATLGTSRALSLRAVAIDPAGGAVAVGASRATTAGPADDAPLILRRGAGAGTFSLSQAQYLANTAFGGLNDVAIDPAGATLLVGTRSVGTGTAAVAYRLPASSTAPLANLSAGLPATIEALEGIATDGSGTWVAVGGNQGAVTRTVDLGATWSLEVLTAPGPKARRRLFGITFAA